MQQKQSINKIYESFDDFIVKYKFRPFKDWGRKHPAHQGYRSDFWYPHSDHKERQIFMIWPAFEDKEGNLIELGRPVNNEGIARMKIVSEEMVNYHRLKIKVGTRGHFMESPRKVADCEVIQLGHRLL